MNKTEFKNEFLLITVLDEMLFQNFTLGLTEDQYYELIHSFRRKYEESVSFTFDIIEETFERILSKVSPFQKEQLTVSNDKKTIMPNYKYIKPYSSQGRYNFAGVAGESLYGAVNSIFDKKINIRYEDCNEKIKEQSNIMSSFILNKYLNEKRNVLNRYDLEMIFVSIRNNIANIILENNALERKTVLSNSMEESLAYAYYSVAFSQYENLKYKFLYPEYLLDIRKINLELENDVITNYGKYLSYKDDEDDAGFSIYCMDTKILDNSTYNNFQKSLKMKQSEIFRK